MSRLLSRQVVGVAGYMTSALALVVHLYGQSFPFAHFGYLFGIGSGWGSALAILAVPPGGLVAIASAVLDCRRRSGWILHRIDYFFVLVAAILAVTLAAVLLELGRHDAGWHLFCVTTVVVVAGYLVETTLVRLRARTLRDTVCWPRVFGTLPVRRFSGGFILAVVVVATAVLLLGGWSAVDAATEGSDYFEVSLASWFASNWIPFVALPAAVLAIVAILGQNIVTVTAARQQAIEAQLREERFRAELVTNITHDLRTPLTSIISYAGLIDGLELDDPRLAGYTAVLQRTAERLRVLVGDLLEASRVSAGNLPVQLAPIDLTEILGQVAGDFDAALSARELSWEGPAAGRLVAWADGAHLWRILENLVGNIVKYAKPGSSVLAEVVGLPGVAAIRLTNLLADPLALPVEQLTAQFVRGDAARHGDGNGLGLFIADRLARLMGAELSLEVTGERFTVTVALPALEPPRPPVLTAGTGGSRRLAVGAS